MNQKNGRKHARGASILLAPSSNSAVSAAAQMSLLDATKSLKDDKPLLLQQHPLNLNPNPKDSAVGLALFGSEDNNASNVDSQGQKQQFSGSDQKTTVKTATSGLVETVDMMEKYLHAM